MATRLRLRPDHAGAPASLSDTAHAYDTVAAAYLDHAEGNDSGLFEFSGTHGYTDRALWLRLDLMLVRLWTEGRRAIRILDAGCGPGTWLLRIAIRARDLGFSAIDARGIDISPVMIDLARSRAGIGKDGHIGMSFEVGNIVNALDDEDDGSFDIVLCLNGVLNHLDAHERAPAAAAMERVCDGEIFITVHSVGGNPCVYLADAYDVRQFLQDNGKDRLDIDLADGRTLALPFHLFNAIELPRLFSDRVRQVEVAGLDLFHTRFRIDPRWNKTPIDIRERDAELDRLEQLCDRMTALIDFSSQILFHGRV